MGQWTIDIVHNLSEKDRLHGYYASSRRDFLEPSRGSGGAVPGFGASHFSSRRFFSLNHALTFGSDMVNVEFERAARANDWSRLNGWLFRVKGREPDSPLLHQSTCEWGTS